MSSPNQQILQECYILATGRAANAGQLTELEDLILQTGGYDTIVALVNEYMGNLANQLGEVGTLQGIIKNSRGIELSSTQSAQMSAALDAQGIDTWAKKFVFLILQQDAGGITLDNRAIAANEFLKSVDAFDKSFLLSDTGASNAVHTLLQNIGSSASSLANGIDGFNALASNLTPSGITGSVVAVGYVMGATVFADTNHDGIHNAQEWSTTTNAGGHFVLPTDIITDKVIAFGGVDMMTGNAFQGVLSSFSNGTMLNPLTTMIEAMIASGQVGTVAEATTAVRIALGLPQNVNLLTYDPLSVLASSTATSQDKATAFAVEMTMQQIANVLTQIAAVINSASVETSLQSASVAVTNALVNMIVNTNVTITGAIDDTIDDTINIKFNDPVYELLDLTSVAVLGSIIQTAVTALGTPTISIQQVEQIARIISASNTSAAAAINITQLDQAANVSQGTATTALIDSANHGDFTTSVAGFTGAALNAANRDATVGFIDTGVPVPPPPDIVVDAPPAPLPPVAPTGLALAIADDSGVSNTDRLTSNTTGLTISGAAQANSTVKLFDSDVTTLLGTGTATGGIFIIDVALAAGVHNITAKSTDASNNTGAASSALIITVDTTPPVASIVLTDTTLKAGQTSLVTITFNEAVTGFTNADLSIANGTLTNAVSIDGGITWTATFTPTADVTATTNPITLTNTGVTDVAGNAGVGTTNSNNYAIDTLRPTATIVVTDSALKAGETSLVTITFNEAVWTSQGLLDTK